MADFVLPACPDGRPLSEALRLLDKCDAFWLTETGVPIRPRLLVPQFCALVEARRYRVKGHCGSRDAPLTEIPEGTLGHFDFSHAAFDELREAVSDPSGGVLVVRWFDVSVWPAEELTAAVAADDPIENVDAPPNPSPIESELYPAARELLKQYPEGRPRLPNKELARALKVSLRTVSRVLRQLRQSGRPGW
jgi:hypothetical protein